MSSGYYEAVPSNLTLAELKLDHISPEWIQQTDKPNYLKKALRLLKDDGNIGIVDISDW